MGLVPKSAACCCACCSVLILLRFRYDWGWESFSVRNKEFWPLDKAHSLFDNFLPRLCHESDGLILQVTLAV